MNEQRYRLRLRRLIDLCLQAVGRGVLSLSQAAETMEAAGAPFEVVCRVLMPFKHVSSQQSHAVLGVSRADGPANA